MAQITMRGSATTYGERCYRLTEATDFQIGAIVSDKKVSLNRPFELLAKVYLGSKNISGADGMAFFFHQVDNFSPSSAASDFGLNNATPSMVLEMDTYSGSSYGDPLNDHMAIQRNGSFQHSGANVIVPPVNFTNGFSLNVEDGDEHTLRFVWNPATKNIKVYFDCELRINKDYDLINNVFNGNADVYWGFTGATGLNNNEHRVCILRCSALDDFQEKVVCDASPTQLTASIAKTYAWSPANNLSAMTIRNPIATPSFTTTYICNTTNECNTIYRDTFQVIKSNLTPFDWTEKASICEGKDFTFDAKGVNSKTYKWQDGSTASTFKVLATGKYTVTISDGNCENILTSDITVNPTPRFTLGDDVSICANQDVVLKVNSLLFNLTYDWSTGVSDEKITVISAGTFWARARTNQNCEHSDTIKVSVKPIARDSQYVQTCEGKPYNYLGRTWSRDTVLRNIFVAKNGCDSFFTLRLKVLPKRTGAINIRICEGATYDFFGQKINKSGPYVKNLTAANGCDSLLTLTLKVINSDTSRLQQLICKNTSYVINNQTFDKEGIFSIKLKNSIGCDSFVLLDLRIDKGEGYRFSDTICNGQTYDFDNKTLSKSGAYTLTLKNRNQCDSIITLNLWVKNSPPVILTTNKILLCANEETVVKASGNYNQYQWSVPNWSGNSQVVDKGGKYRVSVTDESGCVGFDSIIIRKSTLIEANLTKKSPTCSGYSNGEIAISINKGGIAPFNVSLDGKTFFKDLVFKNLKEGDYSIYIKDSIGCETKLTDNLYNPIPKRVQLSDNQLSIALGDSALVNVIASFADVKSVTWTPERSISKESNLEVWLKPVFPTKYLVTVLDDAGCKFTDTVAVRVDSRLKLYMPNVFSANIDGTNDEFRPYAGAGVSRILSFRIFDRWGNAVYEALDYAPTDEKGWDGYYRGQRLSEGVYTYHVRVLKLNSDVENVVGEMMMMR